MNKRQVIVWLVLMAATYGLLHNIHNGTFGLLDNGPMLLIMLLGLEPDGWLGRKLAPYNIDPVYMACGVAMMTNTMTDGIAGLGDPDASFFGVVLGCLIPIAFLPIIWALRDRDTKTATASAASDKRPITYKEPTTYVCPWRVE